MRRNRIMTILMTVLVSAMFTAGCDGLTPEESVLEESLRSVKKGDFLQIPDRNLIVAVTGNLLNGEGKYSLVSIAACPGWDSRTEWTRDLAKAKAVLISAESQDATLRKWFDQSDDLCDDFWSNGLDRD